MAVRNNAWLGILSPRQAEVLELIADGHTNQQIADELGIGIESVRSHRHTVYAKLDIPAGKHARIVAARWWIEHVEHGQPHQTRRHRLLNYFGCNK